MNRRDLIALTLATTLAGPALAETPFDGPTSGPTAAEAKSIVVVAADLKNGGVDLAALSADFNPSSDVDRWVKVESFAMDLVVRCK